LTGLVEEFLDGLRAGEPHAVEAANRLLGTMALKHPPSGLTDRQSEVVSYVARGFSAAEIGIALSVSEHTVRDHLKNARATLGARTRAHLVALWMVSQARPR
jgi:DNA-binding CsgD family transcriptional regulator